MRASHGNKPERRHDRGSTNQPTRRWFGIVFGSLVALCLAQVAWWIVFQLESADRLERLARSIEAGDTDSALLAFGATSVPELLERADQQRSMFALEGATLGILVLLGVVFLYSALIRERRLRRERSRFLAGATHELKTPLATIRLGLESLTLATLPEERRATYLQGMLREADRLESGLTNLLVAAGLETTARSEWQTDDLGEDISRVLDSLEERATTQRLRFSRHAFPYCPVRRDRESLRICLHNLFDNAIKFSESGGSIDVDLTRSDKTAVLTIRDSGCGIESQEIDRIFDRFYRAGPEHIGGTGLGLALVKEIVRDHGGQVRARSEGVGEGSTFTVEMPLDLEALELAPTQSMVEALP